MQFRRASPTVDRIGRPGRRRQMPSEFERRPVLRRISATIIIPTSRAEHTSGHGIKGAGDAALASENCEA
jgi:hypothetical protein